MFILFNEIETKLKDLLQEKSREHDWEIKSLEVMPDHIHIFIGVFPHDSPQYVIAQLKGHSSRYLRLKFNTLTSRLPTLWTRSYYCESVGHISEKTVRK